MVFSYILCFYWFSTPSHLSDPLFPHHVLFLPIFSFCLNISCVLLSSAPHLLKPPLLYHNFSLCFINYTSISCWKIHTKKYKCKQFFRYYDNHCCATNCTINSSKSQSLVYSPTHHLHSYCFVLLIPEMQTWMVGTMALNLEEFSGR